MRLWSCLVAALCAATLQTGCLLFHGQQYRHFTTSTPVPAGEFLVVGFLGGRDSWDDPRPGVARLARQLRAKNLPGVHVETVENKEWELALQLVHNSLDRNQNDILEEAERDSMTLILYGQSFGGAAVIRTARALEERGVPLLLTVQIDSVGFHDGLIPSNVACAANLFQDDGWLIQGEQPIRAAHPDTTRILGNFRYQYAGDRIDLFQVPWWKKIFRVAHTKMEHDPEVWSHVKRLILNVIQGGCQAAARAMQ